MDLSGGTIRTIMEGTGPQANPIQSEMEQFAEEEEFPIVGVEVGGVLEVLARMVNAERIFEFGSGFGYSASWFLRGLSDDGEIILTEKDPEEAELGREFFNRLDELQRVTYEVGDALETIERYEGPFDLVLIDCQKDRYVDAFESVRQKLRQGGIIIADDMMGGPADLDVVLEGLVHDVPSEDVKSQGVIDFLKHVRTSSDFVSVVLPIRHGAALCYKI